MLPNKIVESGNEYFSRVWILYVNGVMSLIVRFITYMCLSQAISACRDSLEDVVEVDVDAVD